MDKTVFANMMPFFGLLFAWAVVLVTTRKQRHQIDAQRDVQQTLLGKFNSGEDLARFLSTPEGREFVDRIALHPYPDPRRSAAEMSAWACVLLALASAFVLIRLFLIPTDTILVPAYLLGAIGVGLLAGAAIYRRFGRKRGPKSDRGEGL
jgi:hypothetical protein